MLYDRFRYVAVHIESDTYAHVGSDDLAHGAAELAVHVGELFADRCAVVGDQHRVPRALIPQHAEHLFREAVVSVLCDGADRAGHRVHQRHEFEAKFLSGLGVAGDRVLCIDELGDDLIASQNARSFKRRVIGRHARKRVRLM